jgi:hypothetical protein
MKPAIPVPLGRLLTGLFWTGIAILVLYGTRNLPPGDPGGLGPATFPRILAISLFGLVAIYWIQSRKAASVPFLKSAVTGSVLKSATLSALALASTVLWAPLGALPVLVALSIIELKWIEGFGWPRVLAVGLSLSIGMWVVFTQLLGVSLPLGILLGLY